MKNNLTISILLLITVFVSCKKDAPASKASVKNSSDGVIVKPLVVQPNYTYVDMELDPRPAGQNYDTYHAIWGGVTLKFLQPYWDSDSYPNLVNGVPLYATTSIDPNSQLNGVLSEATANGQLGSQFAILEDHPCALPGNGLHDDIAKYELAFSNAVKNNTQIPILDDYVKKDYGSGDCPALTSTFKLIRCTTGTHFAVASTSYPVPTPNNNPVFFTFDNSYGEFTMRGGSNSITQVASAINFGSNPASQYSIDHFVGHYTYVGGGSYNIQVDITISGSTLQNPVTFSYSGTAQDGF